MIDELAHALAESVGAAAQNRGLTVAAAESVTGGHVATSLAAAAGASEWFAGSVVAYRTSLKQSLLGVTGPRVITAACASEMLTGVLLVTGADFAVATTGAGGPDPQEGQPPGTVFVACGSARHHTVFEHHFGGAPEKVVALATRVALDHLKLALERSTVRG